MSVAISWAKKVQLAKCDISVGFPKSSHISWLATVAISIFFKNEIIPVVMKVLCIQVQMMILQKW